MMEKFIGEVVNLLTANRCINIYSKKLTKENKDQPNFELDRLLSTLAKEYGESFIDIDIQKFCNCEIEEEEATIFLEAINKNLRKNSIETIPTAISIAYALEKLSKKLGCRTLVVFHLFTDIHDEKEKDLFRALRKFIEIFEGSMYLKILIISSRPTYECELYPESRLDERHVTYKEYPF